MVHSLRRPAAHEAAIRMFYYANKNDVKYFATVLRMHLHALVTLFERKLFARADVSIYNVNMKCKF